MKLTFLGSGSAFTVGEGNYQSNLLLQSDSGKRLLVDCGTDIRFSLYDQGLSYNDIHDVYISHFHSDHVGGLEWLAFNTHFDPKSHKVRLHLSKNLEEGLWQNVLSGGLSSIEGISPNLSSFFEVNPIETNGSFNWEGISFQPIQTMHAMSAFAIMFSYGLFFKVNKHVVYLTTDTQFAPHQIIDFYNRATIILQDCETSTRKSGIHAHFDELITLPTEIKKKMWLYHYNPGPLPDAVKAGFLGFVKKGQNFNLD